MNKNYTVILSNTENKLSGILQGKLDSNNCIEFDPLTVLGDLSCSVEKIENAQADPRDIPDFAFTDNYKNHPFSFSENAFKSLSYSERNSYFLLLDELKNITINNNHLTINDFEIVKQFFQLEFTCKIEFSQPNPEYFTLGYVDKPQYHYLPLEYTYNYDFKKMLEDNNSLSHRFVYSCYSISDIVFSVLHYLLLFRYRFKKCEHCGGIFAAKTDKQKYCTRTSPLGVGETSTCWAAVDYLKKMISYDRKKRITYLNDYYPKAVELFLREYDKHSLVDGKKVICSCENLEILRDIVRIDYVRKNWYKEQYK